MTQSATEIWRTALTVPAQAVEAFESVLSDFCDSVTWFMVDQSDEVDGALGEWVLEGYGRVPPDKAALALAIEIAAALCSVAAPVAEIAKVPDTDWISETMRNFPPVAAGRYFIHGSHYDGQIPWGRIGLMVDAGTAFGSGEHATTWSCLKALDHLAKSKRPRRVLDIGCGSGILGMAAAKTWPVPVIAADIDPEAARVARFNARQNQLSKRVKALTADGYRHASIARNKPYDLIFSNILARPLCALAPSLARHLAPGGVAILSGLLGRHEKMVLNAHRRHGLSLVGRIVCGDWNSLILKRRHRV